MAVLEIEKKNRIAYLRMNRPEAKNAINLELHNALCAAWDDIEKDDSVDVVIITGTGDAFCGAWTSRRMCRLTSMRPPGRSLTG